MDSLTTCPSKLSPKFVCSRPGRCTCTQCAPWRRLRVCCRRCLWSINTAIKLLVVMATSGEVDVRNAKGQSSLADWPVGSRHVRDRVCRLVGRREIFLSRHQLARNCRDVRRRSYARYKPICLVLTHHRHLKSHRLCRYQHLLTGS